MPTNNAVSRAKRLGSGASIIAFPLMLLFGFALHPNFFDYSSVADVPTWASEFRGSFQFHFGHLLVLLAVPLIIVAALRCMELATGKGEWWGFIGGVLGIFGAVVLAVDKGALTLVLTAFDTLPDSEFQAIYPALQVLLDQRGWLWIVRFLALLPFGFAILTIGLVKARVIGWAQATVVVIGLALLLAPDIEIVNTTGAFLLSVGLLPLGFREMRGELPPRGENA